MTTSSGSITAASATAIGVGGMMGAGLYTLLGLASTTAGVWLPVAFLVGGVVTVFSVYSYAKLGARYPSRGGAAQFLIQCFGDGVIAGGLNVFQFLGWIIAMALYCAGFAGYARALLPWETPAWSGKLIGIGLIAVVVLINMVGSKLVGRAESIVVTVELVILAMFAVLGLIKADPARLTDNGDHHWLGILFAAGLLYVTYEGFGVVTNSAGDMRDPARELPRAMFSALAIVVVVYVVISTVVVMTLSLPAMDASQGHVLSEAGLAAMGHVGFVVIGIAALMATASGVNATMYGDANLAFMVAKSGELPRDFTGGVWRGGTVGMLVAAVLTALFVAFFPLSAVGSMASLAFLIVYGTVSAGHLRVHRETGAKRSLLVLAVALNAALFALLLGYTVHTGPASTWVTLLAVLVLSFVFEVVYRKRTGRTLKVQPVPGAAA
ncbi:APC family permease [Mycobacterium sp. URHB0044]|uniref:APC family permease n=1 Tax=Mycobacterium sp. URHB0044 TaxID=1380386 RepID=UPI00055E2191|nr:APC family permease [Mycobacterium sp. URHB0044]